MGLYGHAGSLQQSLALDGLVSPAWRARAQLPHLRVRIQSASK